MVVQHNLTAMNSNRMLGMTQAAQSKSSEKLSSGYRINRAADDAAGLSISEKMRKQINGLDRASTNAQDGVSAVQTAEGALTEVHSMLQRMNELAVQAANGTNSKDDREAIQNEIEQLSTEIDRVAETTKFNETYLLKGNNSTKTVNINAHDAGLKGTLVQGADTKSTFTMELTIGESVSIAGADYRLYDNSNELVNVQNAVKGATDNVTIDGTTYKYTAATAGKAKFWEDSNGNVYLEDQLKDLVGDGSRVLINGTDAQGNAKVDSYNVVDKTADDAKTINEALKLIENALADASSIGGTKTTASAKVSSENGLPTAFKADLTEVNKKIDEVLAGIDADKYVGEASPVAETTLSIGGKTYTIKGNIDTIDGDSKYTEEIVLGSDGNKIEDANGKTARQILAETIKAEVAATYTAYEENKNVNVNGTNVAVGKGDALPDDQQPLKASGTYKFDITKATATVQKDLTFSLHVGADADMNNKINVNVATMDSAGLGIKGLNVADNTGVAATYAIDVIADAVAKVSEQRSALGAVQNRLEHTIANLDNVVENTTAAESRIRDTDMAEEMVEYSKNNILAQAGQSMLAQANQSTQGILSLLQ